MRSFVIKIHLVCAVILCCLGSVHTRVALCALSTSGEIVNVDYSAQVAFTDITTESLSIGDIVAVTDGDEITVYLTVTETNPAITHLQFSPSYAKNTENYNLDDVIIGMRVRPVQIEANLPNNDVSLENASLISVNNHEPQPQDNSEELIAHYLRTIADMKYKLNTLTEEYEQSLNQSKNQCHQKIEQNQAVITELQLSVSNLEQQLQSTVPLLTKSRDSNDQ